MLAWVDRAPAHSMPSWISTNDRSGNRPMPITSQASPMRNFIMGIRLWVAGHNAGFIVELPSRPMAASRP